MKTATTSLIGAAFVALAVLAVGAARAALDLRHTITGEVLNLDEALPDGRDTPGVKSFLETGRNPYTENPEILAKAEPLFLSACSGCHGHYGEGKIGPGLADNYWTYPKNATDQGLFETMFGGANGQMGPQVFNLTLDEMLVVMAWVRHLYNGPIEDAVWLTDEQKKTFKPYKPPH
ncbi:hypothetical protein ABB55_18535 [Prosthecomicrobium hirschii]|uniref:Cytochrome c-L n=1 Tax=Prosthecodimorpha hirschii TaxID=665126 RepID=A0A0P6VT77_9HYPH|nr:cytochrome c(L), periplasmic [Prosthecomicrobium hirschii]KPL53960.1 hypothetical protein ABB55_18535 [Prosthecomicrobium hirschii]